MSGPAADGSAELPPKSAVEEPATEHVRVRMRLDGAVVLVPWDPTWSDAYEQQARLIRSALRERVVLIEHVGSTSVPGLSAKPVIDVLLVVEDPADEDSYVPELETRGLLLHAREPGWQEHRLLKREVPAVNVHVFGPGAPEVQRLLVFRDHVREHRQDRELYERTKQELAAQRWDYVQDYADAKSAVVEDIMRRALARSDEDAPG
jgi:GrpB-like predicted nucleotidyltransferase (UPF0157 family)